MLNNRRHLRPKSTNHPCGVSARGNEAGVMVTAIGYVRRSKESGARTVSLEDQRARIADYAQGQGWQIAEVVADDNVSGGRRERLDWPSACGYGRA